MRSGRIVGKNFFKKVVSLKLMTLLLLMVVISCSKKEQTSIQIQPDSPIVKEIKIVKKNYGKMTVSEKTLIKDNYFMAIRGEWEKKVQDLFKSKPSAFSQYLQIKEQSMKEASDLLKAKKLNRQSADGVHIKYHGMLKRTIGDDLYDQYIKMMKEENISNQKKGINFLIRF